MQNNFTFVTTNTATMNKDSAKQKHNHRDEYTIKREMEKDFEKISVLVRVFYH